MMRKNIKHRSEQLKGRFLKVLMSSVARVDAGDPRLENFRFRQVEMHLTCGSLSRIHQFKSLLFFTFCFFVLRKHRQKSTVKSCIVRKNVSLLLATTEFYFYLLPCPAKDEFRSCLQIPIIAKCIVWKLKEKKYRFVCCLC